MRIITPYGKTKRESQGADNAVSVRKNSTGSIFTRRQLNLIEGSNVSLSVADDDIDDEIDITATVSLGSTPKLTPQGRLTRGTGEPVNTSASGVAANLYYTPYLGDGIALWNGSAWVTITFAETSLDISSLTSGVGYDVFGYLNSGSLALEKLAWTSATARATAIAIQDGFYCKSGDKTRLYLGSFYALSSSTTADAYDDTADNGYGRLIWNMYNRVEQRMRFKATTDSWSYTTASYRQWPSNGAEGSKCRFFRGLDENPVRLEFRAITNQTGARAGVGLDSVTTSSHTLSQDMSGTHLNVLYYDHPGIGLHYLAPLEYGTGSATWYGDNGEPTRVQAGWSASIWG